jgi:hypothetical protein
MIILIAAALVVLGVVIRAVAANTPLAWGDRAAWVLWAVAAILWLITMVGSGGK